MTYNVFGGTLNLVQQQHALTIAYATMGPNTVCRK